MRRTRPILLVASIFVATILISATDAQAIPAFARKYNLACNTCHTLFPQLNRFGRDFRDNGFRTPEEVQSLLRSKSKAAPGADPLTPAPSHGSSDAQATKDDFWSFIPEAIPFSIQGKFHGLLNPKDKVKSDFQLEELRLQSGGTFTPRVSY